jgi:Arc/MetJ family transcription regulator
MRTNVHLNDELLEEAVRLSGGQPKRAVIEAALRHYVESRAAKHRREEFRARLNALDRRLAGVRVRRSAAELVREDRGRDD